MTHAAMSDADQQLAGISARLLRLSVGIEHVADLLSDLEQGFETLGGLRQQERVRSVA